MARPKAQEIPAPLLKMIEDYPFGIKPSPFEGKSRKEYSEPELREVVKIMSTKIQNYIVKSPNDELLKDFIRPKVGSKMVLYSQGKFITELLDAKTLKRCFSSGTASISTINVFRAFEYILDREKDHRERIARVTGLYYIFSTHNTRKGKFQEAIIWIKNDGKALMKYIDRNNEEVEKEMEAEVIQNINLLLSLREERVSLIFYVFTGSEEKPAFMQAVLTYENLVGNTIANLAVFERVNLNYNEKVYRKKIKEFQAKRYAGKLTEDELGRQFENAPKWTLRENIQYFLLNKARPIATMLHDRLMPFNFEKSIAVYPGPYHKPALLYNNARRLTGAYYIYFNERFSPEDDNYTLFYDSEFYSTVGQGLLEIFINEETGVLECKMEILKSRGKQSLIYSGFIMNLELQTTDYIILSLYVHPERVRYANLLLKVIDEDIMTGGLSITYSSFGNLGLGTVVVVKRDFIRKSLNKNSTQGDVHLDQIIKNGQDKPRSITPFELAAAEENNSIERKIINFLSNNAKSLIVPPETWELKQYKDTVYAGVYKMYSKEGDEEKIKVSILNIFSNKHVTLLDVNNDNFYGQMQLVDNNMTILLKNPKDQRTGYCCILVDGYPPNPDYSWYNGSYSGFSPNNNRFPISKLFLLQFIKKKPIGLTDSKASVEQERPWIADTNSDDDRQKLSAEVWKFFNKNKNSSLKGSRISKKEDI